MYIGNSVKRVEDLRLLSGKGRFIDDLYFPNMLYMAVLRSNYAWARFNINPRKAEERGFTVITFDDTKDFNPLPNFFAPKYPKEYILAKNEAKYFGEPIALIVGRDRYEVYDALELVEVDYDPKNPLIDPFKAMEPNSPKLHEDLDSNLVYTDLFVYGEEPKDFDSVEKVFRYNRILPSPIETNGVIADFDKITGSLTVYANTQIPQVFKTALSIIFNIPRPKIRIIVPDSGGGFGGKIFLKPIAMAALASIITGKPVKYIETRYEHMISAVHGPDRHYKAKILYKGDNLLGMDVELVEDFGAYLHTYQPLPILRQIYHLVGPYKMKYLRFKVSGVVTNKPPTGPYRGLGIPPAVLVLENLVKSVSKKIGISEIDLRNRNLIDKLPYESITGAVYDSGNFKEALRRLVVELERDITRDEYTGVGIAFALEPGSSLAFQTLVVNKPRTPYYEGVYMRMDSGGDVTVFLSTNSMGTGHETSISQVVADVLGISMEDVKVILGDTAGPPGTGFYGSRFSVVAISAVYTAALKLKEKMREYLAKMYNVEKEEVEIENGLVKIKGKAFTVKEAANMIYNRSYLIGDEIGLDSSVTINSYNVNVADEKRRVNFSTTYGVNLHGVVIRVDKETGFIKILKYLVLSDCGNMINPMIVDGQLMGGTAMGIGASLYEKVEYDENGIPKQISLGDYWIPSAEEIPNFNILHMISPSPFTPLGTKGVAEGGATVPPAAIINALEDILKKPIEYVEIPITPEYVLNLFK
ncbi:MAG: xanthine dehydrogenase family protein molybdopterin-binding subunit [Saccharolobus sp.]|uniref:xanthine dehydrogenase family protein molybdopterin-binding subunit n=1 Tax=Saccharolobus sp. TaxID=2100761 RepID=UPI0028CDE4DD|nr:xanthine dehydrogenase family protein molybdopterin-binding subunit [Saccharolobus sp.]MDT7861629.1 xanthine dehydrogenase family protein molybdopterin-binding subunit [Saccharolobus sp.]